jgi:hypothetical protein
MERYELDDIISIIRDVEELERLGYSFDIEDYELKISNAINREVTVELLNSHRGLIQNKDYYDKDTILLALKLKEGEENECW